MGRRPHTRTLNLWMLTDSIHQVQLPQHAAPSRLFVPHHLRENLARHVQQFGSQQPEALSVVDAGRMSALCWSIGMPASIGETFSVC